MYLDLSDLFKLYFSSSLLEILLSTERFSGHRPSSDVNYFGQCTNKKRLCYEALSVQNTVWLQRLLITPKVVRLKMLKKFI